MGFYQPQKGEILIDDIPLKNYNFHSIRKNFSVIMQDTPLFNIVLDDENINSITSVKSVGEKQVNNVKRILEKPFHVIILDEATSSLDTESEHLVQNAIGILMKNRTTLVIAHRLSTIINSDQIIVLDSGNVAEVGTHEELLNKDGVYKKLYEREF